MLVCVVRWKEGDTYYDDHKIIGKDIPLEIAQKMVQNGDAEIIEVDDAEG